MFVFGRENPELLDFIISWENVEYENKIIIPSGEINFSKICRDNETLKTVKSYIQTICVFWAGWGIIAQVWNLLLATLGIDNPYLYKEYQPDDTVSTVIDTTTGEIKGQYYTKRRKIRK